MGRSSESNNFSPLRHTTKSPRLSERPSQAQPAPRVEQNTRNTSEIDVKSSSKSMPRIAPRSDSTRIQSSKSGPVAGIGAQEPLRHKRGAAAAAQDEVLRQNAVERVRAIEEERLRAQQIERAFSDEKRRNMDMAEIQKVSDERLRALEAEVLELRSSNVRLRDAEIASGRELQQLRERNATL